MSNKRRKQVRCTLCTRFRWMGNSKAKKRARDLKRQVDLKEIETVHCKGDKIKYE